jgi:hypothetical protein
MSKNSNPLANVMKHPEHESGYYGSDYFEEGSDIEIVPVEETVGVDDVEVVEEIVVEEYTETCYEFTNGDLDHLDDAVLDQPIPDHHEDESNKGKA